MLNFEEITEIQDENSFANVINIIGTKNLIKCFRSALYNHDICCVTDNEILQKNFKSHFQRIFDNYTPKINVVSTDKYDEFLKEKRKRKKNKNRFVFNPDQDKILHQHFSKNFRPDKFKLEISVLKHTNLKNPDNKQVIKQLNENFNKIIKLCAEVINNISQRKILSKYQMRDFVKTSNENIRFELKDIEHILKYRFDFKPIFLPDNTLNNWGTNTYPNW